MNEPTYEVRRLGGPYTAKHWAEMIGALDHYLAGTLSERLPAPKGDDAAMLMKRREELAAELAALRMLPIWHRQAREVNGGTAEDDPRREASITLTQWLAVLHRRGFPCLTLDRILGSKPGVTRARLWRHGHLAAPPSVTVRYRGVKTEYADSPGTFNRLDITGERHGDLVAVRPTGEAGKLGALWQLRCDCGNERIEPAGQFRRGRIRGCTVCVAPRLKRRSMSDHEIARGVAMIRDGATYVDVARELGHDYRKVHRNVRARL